MSSDERSLSSAEALVPQTIDAIERYLLEAQELISRLPREPIRQAIKALLEAHSAQRQVLIMGNGGGAATAAHFASDLAKGAALPNRPRFRAISLVDNVPLLTAWANDSSYEDIFVEQLANLLQRDDVIIAISGSGNSPNVLKAVRYAAARGARTIGLCGFQGGALAGLVDIPIVVPSDSMTQVEDVHLILEHLICTTLRQILVSEADVPRR